MTLRLSKFGTTLGGETGVGQLMEDVGEAIAAANSGGARFHALGGGNPGSIPALEQAFAAAMERMTRDPSGLRQVVGGYDSPQGDLTFIESTARLLRNECGWDVGPENILLTNGSQSAFFMLFNTLAGYHADSSFKHILLPLTPEYIGYSDVGVDGDLFRSNAPLIHELGDHKFKYGIDFDTLELSEDCAAICLSRPTNPTGNVVTDTELRRLREIAKDTDVPLIIDAAYGLPFPGIVFEQTDTIWDEGCIVCLSLSKIGLPGVRTGIVVAQPDLIRTLSSMNAIMNLATGSFGPGLCRELMADGEIMRLSRDHVRPFYENRMRRALQWLDEYLGDLPWRVHKPEGAFFLWLWFPGLPIDSQTLYERLKRRGVLVIAGHHFFPGLKDRDWRHRFECIRVTYSQQAESVEQGIAVIGEEIRRCFEKEG